MYDKRETIKIYQLRWVNLLFNLDLIYTLILKFYLSLSWKASNYSKFWQKSLDYGFKHKLGTKLSRFSQKPMSPPQDYFQLPEITHNDIPEKYDFREDPEVKEFLRKKPIRDQGDCAASWAFSTVGKQ